MQNHPHCLFVAATAAEASVLGTGSGLPAGHYPDLLAPGISLLITGVGLSATAFWLGKVLATHPYRRVINIGLAGSFDEQLVPGTLVEVVREEFGDLGAESPDSFLSLFEMGLAAADEAPFRDGFLYPVETGLAGLGLPKVFGASVNLVHGQAESIASFKRRSSAQVESMEGAAFVYACTLSRIPSLQVRAISNFVESRRRGNWKITEALEAMRTFLGIHHGLITGASS
ncbi:MAG: futalosine hydrolase [Bacteroidia bacterium]|nr:futalosine hydrolase [Bacteroidia bacterium]